ncbi:MAG TPA: amidohydrolase family protein, partial [Chitinophagales bacterium]|nr:amidohydrolase family protein [Chitinophagales bacterium]
MASLLFLHIDRLLMADNTLTAVRKGSEMREVPSLDNAWLLLENGVVKGFGGMESAPGHTDEVVDAKGRFVLPAFVDSHTHLVFATGREDEFAMRIAGKTYEEIAAASGGILNSARKLREMPEEALFDAALARLEKLRNQGTGAIEIKSGYGLTTASELKMLRVIRKLKEQSAMPIKSTFLGAHALPDQYKNDKDGYISLIIDEMLPKIATEGLADYIDVFCEQGYFTNADTDRI